MSYRCIVLDLDRTTLNSQGKLSEINREALRYAMENGVQVVVASGRPFYALPEEILSFPGLDYAITSNGAAICHIPEKKRLGGYTLSPEAAEAIVGLAEREGLLCECFIRGVGYAQADYVRCPTVYGAAPEAVTYIKKNRRPVEDIFSFIRQHETELDSIDIIVNDPAKKGEMWDCLKEKVSDIYITSSGAGLIEISNSQAGKHTGVAFLMRRLGISMEETAAFGDGDNDAELLSHAGCGIAVANASEKCLAAADYVTLSNEEDGVAHGIYHILSI